MCASFNMSKLSLVDPKVPCDKKRSKILREERYRGEHPFRQPRNISSFLLCSSDHTVRMGLINRVRDFPGRVFPAD